MALSVVWVVQTLTTASCSDSQRWWPGIATPPKQGIAPERASALTWAFQIQERNRLVKYKPSYTWNNYWEKPRMAVFKAFIWSVSITARDQKLRARQGIPYRPSSGFPTPPTPNTPDGENTSVLSAFPFQVTDDFSPADYLVPSETPAPTSHIKPAALSQTSCICIPGCAQMHHLALPSSYEPSQGVLQ